MTRVKVNERILQGIKENSGGDEQVEGFLVGLVYEEASHPGRWWWKDTYKERLAKYAAEWEEADED